jgi:peptidoglycan/LPS O-acetylase OafA/YrhL
MPLNRGPTKGCAVSKLGYMPRLDGLRALAVGGVLLDHFIHSPWVHVWRTGDAGVRLFFVLSGFLITQILLIERDRSESAGASAVRFYGRRLLRLSPALWLAIAAAAALGIANMRHDWWKHGLYLTNFMVARRHNWLGAGHFWTLSVEEQFYLCWFFMVVVAPRRWLLPAILACIVLGPAYRAVLAPPSDPDWPITLLPGQVDTLGLGALLAWAQRNPKGTRVVRLFGSRAVLLACLAITVVLSAPLGWDYRLYRALPVLGVGITSACVICQAARPFAPGRGGPLDWLVLRHIGRISYGLYVYHWFVPEAFDRFRPGLVDPPGVLPKLAAAALFTLIALVLAEASWWLVERPILGLKDRLDGRARTPAAGGEDQLPVAAADSLSG